MKVERSSLFRYHSDTDLLGTGASAAIGSAKARIAIAAKIPPQTCEEDSNSFESGLVTDHKEAGTALGTCHTHIYRYSHEKTLGCLKSE
jgi:hypothetical protein